ncbi:MAG: hypothetical protein LBD74_04180 [Spirochaetaceae bacterium]|jgi:hypothetical protein|nr:hypothetical protein [Spirochaetaceae bacterium]
MQENIRIPEALLVLFLVLPIIQPFSRTLQAQKGLLYFPLVAAAIGVGLFPAYGFRPECVPLLLWTLVLTIRHIPILLDHLGYLDLDTPPRKGSISIYLGVLLLTAAAALYFAPREDTRLSQEGVRTHTIRDEGRNAELFLRLYGPENLDPTASERPLLLLAPPLLGSVGMVDQVGGGLRDQGFTVLTFSRKGFDSPAWGADGKRYSPPLSMQWRILSAFIQGNRMPKANLQGQTLEMERMADINFLLTYMKEDLYRDFPESGAARNALFLAGYDAGGSALILLGASDVWRGTHPEVRGLIVVESPLWSAYQTNEDGQLLAIKAPIRPQLPTLVMTSDRINDAVQRKGRYAPLLTIAQAQTPVVLAAVAGSGPLDYSDCPAKYPLYAACLSGETRSPWKYGDFILGTASIMTNFASLLLEHLSADPLITTALSRRKGLGGAMHFETGGAWDLPDFGYVLTP